MTKFLNTALLLVLFYAVLLAQTIGTGAKNETYTLPAGFSHMIHLRQAGMTCLECHTGIPDSRTVSDDNRPPKEVCLGCHEESVITGPDSAARESRHSQDIIFSHKMHVEIDSLANRILEAAGTGAYLGHLLYDPAMIHPENRCTACHRGLDETAFSGKRNFPSMSDCLVCHSRINPPFSCKTCHPAEFDILPASHTDTWLDDHTKGVLQDAKSCTPCHGVDFSCRGCH